MLFTRHIAKARLRIVLCAVALAAISVGPTAVAAGGEKPAALSLKDMQGSKVKLSDLRGKIVVLNFWATWCGPCNAEMPMLVKAAATYSGKNVTFIGVSVDAAETQSKVAGYVQKLQIAYPIWVGGTEFDLKRMQLGEAV